MAKETYNDTVKIAVGNVELTGDLIIPENARGLVLFSHGSGSSRLSSRNRYVAQHLQEAGFATLLFDLLTPQEDENYQTRFNIPLLTERLIGATGWAQKNEQTRNLDIGYFGASTGAASALGAAASLVDEIKAVVSRGGRPDMADAVLPDVLAPTLLIVGGKDDPVIDMNKDAYDRLHCIKEMEIVPDATHLFEEPGALEMVADLALDWFKKYLAMDKQRPLVE
ncbi:MAG: dienelactone hydrolase family protein [Hymenobacteraceae bacterium]|nr:dienelactone hydrolase family protein [Hymenobacteraceae bacterium]MDX5395177.1 dienelactone hydrolase family protein [Hymenobacteraceae bacterium]MDX5511214.1 dienelactone hydrolase family protein [Hymenobacteraceae bacterium]